MNDLVGFDASKAKPLATFELPADMVLTELIKAVGGPHSYDLRRNLTGNPGEGWHQLTYPGPVLHWAQQDGICIVELYSNERTENGSSPGAMERSSQILNFLQQYIAGSECEQSK